MSVKDYIIGRAKEWSSRISLAVMVSLPFMNLEPIWNGAIVGVLTLIAGVPDEALLSKLRRN